MGFYDPEVEQRLRSDADDILGRYPQGHERSALLPLLHLVQSEDGYVSSNGIALCADILDISQAEVSAVATFYTQYKRHPNGEYTVGVCTNALCAVMGGDAIFEALQDHLDVGNDETTADGKITLEAVECNAACDYAPVIMVNWEFFDNQTPGSAKQLVDDIQAGKPVTPTRGPDVVPTFKEMSHILAGFPDEHAHEGVSAGPASLTGLKAAQQRGWTTDYAHEKPSSFAATVNTNVERKAGTQNVGKEHSSAEHSGAVGGDTGGVKGGKGANTDTDAIVAQKGARK
ncbi:MAG: NADH-quinone oxidoreductase subunit NuoE [Actinomycetaceae bacterium]|nr:NADH-quinone oxidoreductase subunit NuoE [Actinomycetaceae bacterium]